MRRGLAAARWRWGFGDGQLYAWQLRGSEWQRDSGHEQRLDSTLQVTALYVGWPTAQG